jgi:hypothetical protein
VVATIGLPVEPVVTLEMVAELDRRVQVTMAGLEWTTEAMREAAEVAALAVIWVDMSHQPVEVV